MDTQSKLVHAVIAFDEKQEARARNPKAKARGYHNMYALSQYLRRVDDVMADIEAGATPEAAIIAGFAPGPLRNACLRAIGCKASNVEASGSYKGLPVYQPASGRRGA